MTAMADVFSKKERSRIMSLIKSKDTGFETAFLRALSAQIYPLGFRYRKHYTAAIGKPDIAFIKQKLAVFLDSDFWHGRNFKKLRPSLRSQYWLDKILRNKERDKRVNRALRRLGWTVLRFGENSLKERPTGAVNKIIARLQG